MTFEIFWLQIRKRWLVGNGKVLNRDLVWSVIALIICWGLISGASTLNFWFISIKLAELSAKSMRIMKVNYWERVTLCFSASRWKLENKRLWKLFVKNFYTGDEQRKSVRMEQYLGIYIWFPFSKIKFDHNLMRQTNHFENMLYFTSPPTGSVCTVKIIQCYSRTTAWSLLFKQSAIFRNACYFKVISTSCHHGDKMERRTQLRFKHSLCLSLTLLLAQTAA